MPYTKMSRLSGLRCDFTVYDQKMKARGISRKEIFTLKFACYINLKYVPSFNHCCFPTGVSSEAKTGHDSQNKEEWSNTVISTDESGRVCMPATEL